MFLMVAPSEWAEYGRATDLFPSWPQKWFNIISTFFLTTNESLSQKQVQGKKKNNLFLWMSEMLSICLKISCKIIWGPGFLKWYKTIMWVLTWDQVWTFSIPHCLCGFGCINKDLLVPWPSFCWYLTCAWRCYLCAVSVMVSRAQLIQKERVHTSMTNSPNFRIYWVYFKATLLSNL